MRKRIVPITLALMMAAALALTALAATSDAGTAGGRFQAPETVTGSVRPAVAPGPKAAAAVKLNTADHVAYIMGDGAGYFNPGSDMTRAEVAVMLYRLLSAKVPVTVDYADVAAGSWYADAAVQMGSLGLLRAGESTFQGEEPITRGEFVNCIAAFFPPRTDAVQFADVSPTYRYAVATLSGRAHGWLSGYADGTFHPEQTLARSEAVSILNRALGRSGYAADIAASRPALFLDVPVDAWYYSDVIEATVPHTYTVSWSGAEVWTSFQETDTGLPADFRTDGLHLYQGWCYYYDAGSKDILRSTARDGRSFDAEGHFTTGDAWVDQQLRDIILSRTNSGMTREEMLRALFGYCRDSYKYLKWKHFAAGDTSFTLEAARQILSTGRGNCYCYASTFWYLARWLGYDAKIISGYMYSGDHSWVEIDGYIYDTQLEWRYVRDWDRSQYLWHFYHLVDSEDEIKYRK